MLRDHILVVVPAHNEAEHISHVVLSAIQYLPVLVIDDGSDDNTALLAETSGAAVLQQFPNQGKGAALQSGFRQVLQEDWAAVITIDGDGQHDPQDIPLFLRAYQQNQADLIIGARQFKDMPFTRRLGNTLGQALFSWAVRLPVPDNQSGFRLISRRMIEAMIENPIGGFEFEVEMVSQCILHGYQLSWVPIHTIYAGQKSHIQPVRHVFRFLSLIWRTRRRTRIL